MTSAPAADVALGSYEQVAGEYYDFDRHPTCANFREASRSLLETLVPDLPPAQACEVGCGDSLLASIFVQRDYELHGLLLTDAHASMLEHSRPWASHGATLSVAPARRLPVPDASLAVVVASLADPYDDASMWAEVARVLTPDGRCVVTTPSSVWGERFRSDGQPEGVAHFDLRDGTAINVPSYLRSPADERRLIEGHGLELVRQESIPLRALTAPLSNKLQVLGPEETVVDGYLVSA